MNARPPVPGTPRRDREPGLPDRSLYAIVLVDAHGSGSVAGRGQFKLRRDLYELVEGALTRRSFTLGDFPFSDTGDGLRLLIPLHRIEPNDIVDMFVLGLIAGLRQHRRYTNEAARIRLRVAFDLGLIEPHLQGWAGDPLVRVARLIDAEPVREVLRANSQLDLVAVTSDVLYEVIRPGDGYIPVDCFRPVEVQVKEFGGRAWLLAPHPDWPCGSCGLRAA